MTTVQQIPQAPAAVPPKPPAPPPPAATVQAPKPATAPTMQTMAAPAGAQTMSATTAAPMQRAAPAPVQPVQVQTPQVQKSVAEYMSPYLDASLTPTIQRIQDAGAKQRSQLGTTAASAGAFGDARHGVTEAAQMRDENRNIGDYTTQAYNTAWDKALGMQNADLDRAMTAALANAGYADSQLGREFQSGENAADRDLNKLMQSLGFDFQSKESAANRTFQSGENAADRTWQTGERQAGQQFQAGENANNRNWQSGEAQLGRQFQAGESAAQRNWQSGESANDRTFTAGQNQADRTLAWDSLMKNLQDRGLDRQQAAAIAGQQFALAENAQGMENTKLQMALDNYERGWAQQEKNASYEDFLAEKMWPITLMQQIGGIGSSVGGLGSSTSTTSQPNNSWANAIGGLVGSWF